MTDAESQAHILAAHLLLDAHFRFKTFQEAMVLAEFLSEICPNKMLTHMGLAELFTNAVEHGNLGITSEEKSKLQQEGHWLEEIERRLHLAENKDKWVNVSVTKTEHTLQVTVQDQGLGFNWKYYQNKQEERDTHTQGRGITLAKDLCFKELHYSEKGNEVTAVIRL